MLTNLNRIHLERDMHPAIADVLERRDLSKAANLFDDRHLTDNDIVVDLPLLIHHVKLISNSNRFLLNYNDQSVAEICLARILSAVKDTKTIERHIESLVDLLESCLHHDLGPSSDDRDPPHAKIASDLISCIFLNYNSKSVMIKVLPVAVKFLHRGNKELSKNLSSYLSLTVIDYPALLIPYNQIIIDAIIGGNHSLIRVLPKIYAIMPDKTKFHDHVMALTCLLPLCEIPERLPLLNLFSLMSKTNPYLLESNLPVFVRCLSDHQTVYPTLEILLEMAQFNPELLADYLDKITDTCLGRRNVLPLCVQFFGIIGRNIKAKSKECLMCLSRLINSADQTNIIMLLREMNTIVRTSPQTLQKELQTTIDLISSKKNLSSLPSVRSFLNQLSMPDSERRISDDMRLDHDRLFSPTNHLSSNSSSVCSNYQYRKKLPPMINFNYNYSLMEKSKPLPSPTSPTSVETRYGQSFISDSGISPSINTTSSNGSSTKFHSQYNHIPKLDPTIYLPASRLGAPSHNKEYDYISSQIMCCPNRVPTSQKPPCQACNYNYKSKTISDKKVRIPKLQNLPFGRHLSSSSNFVPPKWQTPLYPPTCYGTACLYGQDIAQNSILQCSSLNPYKNSASNCHIYSIKEISDPLLRSPPSKCFTPGVRSTSTYQTYDPQMEHGYLEISSGKSVVSQNYARPDHNNRTPLPDQSPRCPPEVNSDGRSASSQPSAHEDSNYVSQDVVQRFCDKHLGQIKAFVDKVKITVPLPIRCSVDERKNKKSIVIHFVCEARKNPHCLSSRENCHSVRTKYTRTWVHLIFLALQSRSDTALSCSSPEVAELKNCWSAINLDNNPFQMLVTSSFPTLKDQEALLNELKHNRYFDMFEFDASSELWSCLICHQSTRVCLEKDLILDRTIKEKKPKWKLFKLWQERHRHSPGVNIRPMGEY